MITPIHVVESTAGPERLSLVPSQGERIHELLLAQKAEINQSIREYPLPITACDDQFNYLLEKRSAITLELGRFKRVHAEILAGQTGQDALDEFIASSQFVDR